MKTVPAEEVLAELDRIAGWGWEDLDPGFVAEINRRIDDIESATLHPVLLSRCSPT